ncbi:MAG: ABC transporter ATP-binding protein [Clostridia bacterium]|nr:ABC transporter ATP-binding protein [Clostridia bacterium]MDD4386592.1 ABC transporter ATP-binding protein [Clostridia bacterium]
MGGGPMRGMAPADKPKDFKGTFKRLIKYMGKYSKAVIAILFILVLGTILSVVSPKILGKATTELGNNIMQKIVYNNIQGMLEKMPIQMKNALPENATVQTLMDMKVVPDEYISKIPEVAKVISLKVEPKINFKYIGEILLVIIGLYVVSALFTYIANRAMAYISQKVTYNLRKEMDQKLDRLPLKFFDKHTHGEILSRVTNDIDNISTMLQQSLVQILQSIFTIIGIFIMMLTISFSMTGVAILVLPVSMIFIISVVKASQKYFVAQQRVLGEINGHIEETYSGDLIVKSFNMQEAEIEKFTKINDELYKHSWKSQFLSGLMMPIINVINNLGYIGICILGANLAIQGKMSIGDIQAFLQYTNQFTQPIAQAAQMMNMIQGTIASAERVFEILDEEEESLDVKNPIKLEKVKGNIVCDDVEFSYNKNEKLIENWSLNVKSGQTVAIVGPTGAGKTTIVNLLMKFYDIQGGDIRIDDKSIKDMTRTDVRKMFAMVLQDTWLFNGTIRENLRYSKQDALDSEVERAVYLAHANHFIKTLPGGYDFVLNEEVNNISQGQKQLLTIARAILADAPILILDEATSNVDTRTEQLIQKAMNKLMQGRTSFVIAHRLSTIKNADIIIVMDHGRIVERGNHDELLDKNGLYSKLYNSQFSEESA